MPSPTGGEAVHPLPAVGGGRRRGPPGPRPRAAPVGDAGRGVSAEGRQGAVHPEGPPVLTAGHLQVCVCVFVFVFVPIPERPAPLSTPLQ